MTKYKLELTETQLRIINNALEEYFRIPLNQWGDLADRLAFKGFSPKNDKGESKAFDRCINKRDAAVAVFEAAGKILWGYDIPRKDKNQLIAEDIWQVIRHQLYLDSENKNIWRVDSMTPIQWGRNQCLISKKFKRRLNQNDRTGT